MLAVVTSWPAVPTKDSNCAPKPMPPAGQPLPSIDVSTVQGVGTKCSASAYQGVSLPVSARVSSSLRRGATWAVGKGRSSGIDTPKGAGEGPGEYAGNVTSRSASTVA